MEKGKLATIGFIVLILLIVGTVVYSKNTGQAIKDIPSESVAKWIGEHSVLYVQTGCSHCKEQEDLFGNNVKYINIIDGIKEENRQKFIDAEIEYTPTWVINGQKYVGVQSIEKLKEITGYQG